MNSARLILNARYAALLSGVVPDERDAQRTLSALRDLRAIEGAAVANDYRQKLRAAALIAAGRLMSTMQSTRDTSGASVRAPRGVAVDAATLQRMANKHAKRMRALGVIYT